MKFSIERDQILEALQKVQSIIEQRTTLPILANVLIEAKDEKILFTASDKVLSVRTNVDGDVIEQGSTTLPARRFFTICRELPNHQIDIEIDENNVAEIKAGASVFKLEGLPKDDFPPMPTFEESSSYVLPQNVFKDALQKTSYAVSQDESRMILNGCLVAFDEGNLIVVATDGKRLALVEQEVDVSEETKVNIVVPTKTVSELIKTLDGDSDADVIIKTSETQIAFEFSDIFIISKLIEGNYPNYRQVIPSQCEERISIDRDVLASAIKRVSIMLNDQSESMKFSITENKIELLTSSPEVGEARESVAVKYSGKDITIAFNPQFLLAPLKQLDSDEIYMELSDDLSPGVIKSNVPFLYVIMPIRVS